MKGPYHEALRKVLLEKYAQKAFTQESLASETSKDQTTIGHYLRPGGKAGSLDLDEADAALRHVGSSLKAFVSEEAVTMKQTRPKLSKIATLLQRTIHGLEDDELRIVLASARAVRAASRAGRRSALRHVAGPSSAGRKAGGKH